MNKTILSALVLSSALFAQGGHHKWNYDYESFKSKKEANYKRSQKNKKRFHKKRSNYYSHKNLYRGSAGLNRYPKSENLTQELKDSLAYMGNEERLAYDLYMNLYSYFKENYNLKIRQLYNIAQRSESRHIATVQELVKRYNIKVSDLTIVDENVVNSNNMLADNMPSGVYDIAKIQELYDTLYAMGKESKEDALKVGCMVEVTDINDLNEYLKQAQDSNAKDIQAAFEFLREGSYNHYWAFDKGLKNIGVSDGCCSLGDAYCHLEYPKNQKGRN